MDNYSFNPERLVVPADVEGMRQQGVIALPPMFPCVSVASTRSGKAKLVMVSSECVCLQYHLELKAGRLKPLDRRLLQRETGAECMAAILMYL